MNAPGPIVRANDGRELGRHRGLHFYTLGQRKGIGVPSNTDHQAYVVVGKLEMPVATLERRMTVVRLADGGLVVWSAICLDDAGMAALEFCR